MNVIDYYHQTIIFLLIVLVFIIGYSIYFYIRIKKALNNLNKNLKKEDENKVYTEFNDERLDPINQPLCFIASDEDAGRCIGCGENKCFECDFWFNHYIPTEEPTEEKTLNENK